MPELPEVETIKNAIAKGIGNAIIENVEVRNRRLRVLVPNDLEDNITGAGILDYRRVAKYIVVDLDNGFSILWHMGMSGKVKISDVKPKNLDKHDHIIINTTKGCVIYNDPRRFGLFTCYKTDDLCKCSFLERIGLDPFDEMLTKEYLYACLQKRKKTPIKIVLLNQEVVVGIGNIYASEILYESRILPTRESGQISLDECDVLIQNTRKVLKKAIGAGGSTLRDYKRPDGSLGYFQNMHCVYNKTGQRCPNCICDTALTGGIKKSVMGGRSTFYCERLQK
ncbi:MAG: bifunctional DNA-formamidopyrimidine glycosylase/DNA-(apurinic or apyrimidinic site) lyase [Alphaproteobacteria bacterium]|nr:bifunctional DNA-formamidopyrimidine glycosylase/DNA-(apurinic or apyrimidinic site) lyase [Alphaproteobacteria bacterium]